MRKRHKRYISPEEDAYIKLLIDNSDSENRKIGLETLCKFYRSGLVFRDPYRVVVYTMGLLHDAEPRVVRWALNALALIGGEDQTTAIAEAIKRNESDPDILSAGIAALCSILNEQDARRELKKARLPLEGTILLAAAQQSGSFDAELRRTRVNIENADAPELRLASVLVGVGKAPENLFSGRFRNRQVIGQLNRHPDRLVAQYSVWAISENQALGPKALGIDLKEIEFQPDKVRKYAYQAIVSDVASAKKNRDFLVQGSEDKSVEARNGLAIGFRRIYFDSVEELILSWFPDEAAEIVRQRLLEHMATQSDRCSLYEKPVLQTFRDAVPNSLTRGRLISAARETKLFVPMRKIVHDAEGDDLFGYGHVSHRVRSISGAETPLDEAKRAKVLIVTALAKEAAAVKATFDRRRMLSVSGDTNIYEIGVYEVNNAQRRVIHATSGMGNHNASSLATNALRSFPHIEHIIMVGIAGGCPNHSKPDEHVRLGDVVVSGPNGIIAYDFVKQTPAGTQVRSYPQKPSAAMLNVFTHLDAEERLNHRPWEKIADTAHNALGEEYKRPEAYKDVLHVGDQIVQHPSDTRRREGFPRIISGVIGAADVLQKDSIVRDKLRDQFGVRAIEMESSGLQNAAWHLGKDVFVVRGICDYCDDAKNDDWQNYAALIAAAYARAMVESMPSDWF